MEGLERVIVLAKQVLSQAYPFLILKKIEVWNRVLSGDGFANPTVLETVILGRPESSLRQ